MWYPNADEKTFMKVQEQELARQFTASQKTTGLARHVVAGAIAFVAKISKQARDIPSPKARRALKR